MNYKSVISLVLAFLLVLTLAPPAGPGSGGRQRHLRRESDLGAGRQGHPDHFRHRRHG